MGFKVGRTRANKRLFLLERMVKEEEEEWRERELKRGEERTNKRWPKRPSKLDWCALKASCRHTPPCSTGSPCERTMGTHGL